MSTIGGSTRKRWPIEPTSALVRYIGLIPAAVSSDNQTIGDVPQYLEINNLLATKTRITHLLRRSGRGDSSLFAFQQNECEIASSHTDATGRKKPATAFSFFPSRTTAALLVFLLLAAGLAFANSDLEVCPNSAVSIKSLNEVDIDEVCGGAEAALSFFERLNLKPSHPLVVEVESVFPSEVSETAVGCFLQEDARIFVLPFPAFEERRNWFNTPIDKSMYRSLETHEVAHAIAYCNFAVSDPSIQAQEYVAYVVMFATMANDLRERILANNSGTGFENEFQINPVFYALDPMTFGIEAYRHYAKARNGDAFLLDVLAGKVLTDRETELP